MPPGRLPLSAKVPSIGDWASDGPAPASGPEPVHGARTPSPDATSAFTDLTPTPMGSGHPGSSAAQRRAQGTLRFPDPWWYRPDRLVKAPPPGGRPVKAALFHQIAAHLHAKASIPYQRDLPDLPHPFLHNKVAVVDDAVVTQLQLLGQRPPQRREHPHRPQQAAGRPERRPHRPATEGLSGAGADLVPSVTGSSAPVGIAWQPREPFGLLRPIMGIISSRLVKALPPGGRSAGLDDPRNLPPVHPTGPRLVSGTRGAVHPRNRSGRPNLAASSSCSSDGSSSRIVGAAAAWLWDERSFTST
jgi:hypothetical protein